MAMQKIATKLTKKVAEFVNTNGIGLDESYFVTTSVLFHYPIVENKRHSYFKLQKGYTEVSEQEFIDMVTAELDGKPETLEIFNPQPHYNNDKGSLYKVATDRNWNAYIFDVIKRLERGGKKDPLKQEIEKSIDVLKIWLNELPE